MTTRPGDKIRSAMEKIAEGFIELGFQEPSRKTTAGMPLGNIERVLISPKDGHLRINAEAVGGRILVTVDALLTKPPESDGSCRDQWIQFSAFFKEDDAEQG